VKSCRGRGAFGDGLLLRFDHQAEIDREIQAEWQQAEHAKAQGPRSPFFIRMRAKGLL